MVFHWRPHSANYAHIEIVVTLIVVNLISFLPITRTGAAVLDDLLTQRRGFFPLASGRFSHLEVAVAVPKFAVQIFQKFEKI